MAQQAQHGNSRKSVEKHDACIVRNGYAMNRKLKSIPKFRNEAEERRFWETHDSSNYVDWSRSERVRLPNLKPSTTSISLRLPVTLLERIKVAANKRDVPYQSLIKTWLAEKTETR
jgi:predicted DNA binding CopG/RHH family protein